MRDAQIVWDADDDPDGNVQHIAENDLTVEEVESVLLDPESETRSAGRAAGRSRSAGRSRTAHRGRLGNGL